MHHQENEEDDAINIMIIPSTTTTIMKQKRQQLTFALFFTLFCTLFCIPTIRAEKRPLWLFSADNATLTLYYGDTPPTTLNNVVVNEVREHQPGVAIFKDDEYIAKSTKHIVVDPSILEWNTDRYDYLFAYLKNAVDIEGLLTLGIRDKDESGEYTSTQIETTEGMFMHCHHLQRIDWRLFSNNLTKVDSMYAHCLRLGYITQSFNSNYDSNATITSAKGFAHNAHSLRFLDISNSTARFEDEALSDLIKSTPSIYTLRYAPMGYHISGRNIISSPYYQGSICDEYLLSDNIAFHDDTDEAYEKASQNTSAMYWEVFIPLSFQALKVTNDRSIGVKKDNAYTWFAPYTMGLPEGVKAYEFSETSVDGKYVTFVPAADPSFLSPFTPYLIVSSIGAFSTSTEGSYVDPWIPSEFESSQGFDMESPEISEGWKFVGSMKWRTTQEAANEGLYTLQSENYWRSYEGSKVRPRPMRAFMKKPSNSDARSLSILFDTPTTIQHIELRDTTTPEKSSIYDLNGRYLGTRQEVLPTGTYIIGGKTTRVQH